jgi:hypothetical protein
MPSARKIDHCDTGSRISMAHPYRAAYNEAGREERGSWLLFLFAVLVF